MGWCAGGSSRVGGRKEGALAALVSQQQQAKINWLNQPADRNSGFLSFSFFSSRSVERSRRVLDAARRARENGNTVDGWKSGRG